MTECGLFSPWRVAILFQSDNVGSDCRATPLAYAPGRCSWYVILILVVSSGFYDGDYATKAEWWDKTLTLPAGSLGTKGKLSALRSLEWARIPLQANNREALAPLSQQDECCRPRKYRGGSAPRPRATIRAPRYRGQFRTGRPGGGSVTKSGYILKNR
jgi:hypothetical protein